MPESTPTLSTETRPQLLRRVWNNTVVMLRQWWDSDYHPEGLEVVQAKEDKLDVKRTMPFILLHAACLLVFTVSWNWWVFGFAVLFYFFRMFAITAFYHRYFSHRAFSTSRPAQFAFAVIGNMAMQRGALWWASTHRHHHKHSDDEHDIHSPRHKGFWWSHIGWITSHRNFPTDYTRIKDLAKFPELVFLNRHDFFIPLFVLGGCWLSGWLLQTFVPSMGVTGAQMAIWCGVVSTVALMHGTFFINSLAHVFGKRRFKTTDDSRNSLLLAMITLGEGWHNNHHRYQYSARQGFYWWEIDVSYGILKVMSWLGIVWDLQPVPARIYDEAKRLRSEGPGH